MSLLKSFPNPPDTEFVTVCEKNAQLVTLHLSDVQKKQITPYPELNAGSDLMRSSWSKESARSAFVEMIDSPKQLLLKSWYEHGVTGVLNELSCGRFAGWPEGIPFISRPACFILCAVRWLNFLHGLLFPHLTLSCDDMIAEFSANPHWKSGCVRCFAWHPHLPEFAVAMGDDFIHIRSLESHKTTAVERTLKHKIQKGVADLAWMPLSSSILAVACQNCILVWKIDPLSLATNLWSSAVQILSYTGHCPVISVTWCPKEGLLVSASPADNSIMVWSPAMDSYVPLRRFGNGGVTLLRWSPEGCNLFSAGPTSVFRVWECTTWSSKKWSKLLGRCQNACWSPDGSVLLFTIFNEPVLYSLAFDYQSVPALSLAQSAVAAFNLSSVDWQTKDSLVSIGGPLQGMTWDLNGERLAVTFAGSSAHFVAVFHTKLQPTFEVVPLGFIRGQPCETASIISFKPQFAGGSLLTVVWSSGRIAHIPLYYTPRHQVGKLQETSSSDVQQMLFTSTMSSA